MRDNWHCKRCGKSHTPPTNALHCSHFWKRGYIGTRWDFNNCDALCYGCHRFVEGDKQQGSWYYTWKLKELGEQEFELMRNRAQTVADLSYQDLQSLLITFKHEYERLKDH